MSQSYTSSLLHLISQSLPALNTGKAPSVISSARAEHPEAPLLDVSEKTVMGPTLGQFSITYIYINLHEPWRFAISSEEFYASESIDSSSILVISVFLLATLISSNFSLYGPLARPTLRPFLERSIHVCYGQAWLPEHRKIQ